MSMMMVDRPMSMAGMAGSSMSMPGMPSMAPGMANLAMVPQCKMKMEKCSGGIKMTCTSDDEVSCGTLQNICRMLASGMCSCSCMMNGLVMCQCNFAMCNCKCEMIKDGVCITCTSGDKHCCEMLQACGDCITGCMKAGCMCCVSLGGVPCCCSTC